MGNDAFVHIAKKKYSKKVNTNGFREYEKRR